MSLAIKYETPEDAKMRLRNTVVLYKGDPVLIQDVQRGEGKDDILRVLFTELPVGKGAIPQKKPRFAPPPEPEGIPFQAPPAEDARRKYISSKHFDIGPFRLGYLNAKGGAVYCSRMPNRIQKQGLCAENFTATDHLARRHGFDAFLQAGDVGKMVAGDYPSFDKAVELLDKCPAVAFSRDYCLVKDEVLPGLVYLYHKNAKVGMYAKGDVSLGNKFACLKESLEEMKLKVGVM